MNSIEAANVSGFIAKLLQHNTQIPNARLINIFVAKILDSFCALAHMNMCACVFVTEYSIQHRKWADNRKPLEP